MRCVHEGARDHVCDVCSVGFSQASSLRRHVSGVHQGARDYVAAGDDCSTVDGGAVRGS